MDERDKADDTRVGPGKTFYKRKRFIIPLVIFLVAAVVVTSYWYINLRGYQSTDDAYVDGDKIVISSKIPGRIIRLTSDEGDTVSQGQLMVQLDDSDLRAQRALSEANVASARQNETLAKINLQKAQEDYDRAALQFKDKVIPKEQYDHAKRALDQAAAQHDISFAQINSALAQLNVVKTQLQNTEISAPSKGIVARRWLISGDVTQPGQPIFTLYDLDSVWITANFEETKIASMKAGDPVQISIDAYPNSTFQGRIILLGAAAASQFSLIPPNNASGNFTKVTQRVPVRIAIDRPSSEAGRDPARLLPGMSAVVKVSLKED